METTKEYNKFKFVTGNRALNRRHINKIKESISEYGYLKSNPILVTQDFKILDGQHRFTACKEMGKPIYYQVINTNKTDLIIDLNITQKKWTNKDYVTFYAMEKKNPYYINLSRIMDTTKLDVTSCLMFAWNKDVSGQDMKKLKEGKLLLVSQQVQHAFNLFGYVKALKDCLRLPLTGKFCKAAAILHRLPNFRWETMLDKATKYPTKAYNCVTLEETIEMLRNLYNYQIRIPENRI